MNIYQINSKAWDHEVETGNRYATALSKEEFEQARIEGIKMPLTPTKKVPPHWLGDVRGKRVLCLAASGGQQVPLFALMGAEVTALDGSEKQLELDRMVAEREKLTIRTEQGDMRDLSRFADGSFDLVFHAVSNCFVPDIRPVWKECARVLRPEGVLISGFLNPVNYIFDADLLARENRLDVRYRVPYSDLEQLPAERLQKYLNAGEPLEFGHTLEDQIGEQLRAGFYLTDLYEDESGFGDALDCCIPTFLATRAIRK